ncbi:hypothetical protein CW304_01205 [Bacillus sp. UFRGS-B20]|nr:hypothetical protein CW304_01205 [Bacillus sp. UFRGS-B20]
MFSIRSKVLLFRLVTKTVRDFIRADKAYFLHFIYVTKSLLDSCTFILPLNKCLSFYENTFQRGTTLLNEKSHLELGNQKGTLLKRKTKPY